MAITRTTPDIIMLCSRITSSRREGLLVLTAAAPSRASFSEGQSAGLPANIHLVLCSQEHCKQSRFLLFCFVFSSFVLKKKKWRDNLFVLFFLFCCGSKSFSKNFQACSYTYQPNTFTPAIVFNALSSDSLNGCSRRSLHSFARYRYADA